MKLCTLRESQLRMLDILLDIDRVCKENNIKYWLDSGTLLGAIRHKGFIPWDDDLDIGMFRDDYLKFIEVAPKSLNSNFVLQTPKIDNEIQVAFAKVRDLNSEIKSVNNHGKYKGLFVDIFPFDDATKLNMKRKNRTHKIILVKWFSDLSFKKPFLKNIFKNVIILGSKFTKVIWVFKPYNKFLNDVYDKANNIKAADCEEVSYGMEVPFELVSRKEYFNEIVDVEFEGYMLPAPKGYIKVLEGLYGDWKQLPPEESRQPSHSDCIYLK